MLKLAPIELSDQVQDTRYFSFYQDADNMDLPMNIVFGGKENCQPEYNFSRVRFPVYVFEYVLGGTGMLTLDSVEHVLSKGSMYVFGPTIPCSIMNSHSSPLTKYFVAFQCNAESLQAMYPLSRCYFDSSDKIEGAAELVSQLFNEAFKAREHSRRICCNYLDILFLNCVQYLRESRQTHKNSWRVFQKIKNQIEDNFLEFKRMEDISRAVELAPSYVSRLFKQYYHMSPYNFLLKKKMEYALDVLSNTGATVAETALQTGFEDQFHFSRVFKTMMNKPPSAFKNTVSNVRHLSSHPSL